MQQKCQKWLQTISSVYIYLMLTLFLIFMPMRFYVGLTFTKFMFFTVATVAYVFVSLIVRLVFLAKGYGLKGSWARTSWAQRSFLIFIVVMLISSIFSPYKDTILMGAGRYEGIFTWVLYIGTFIMISRNAKLDKWHIVAFGGTVSFICIISLIQYFGINILYPAGSNYVGTHFLGTIGNVNMVSGLLCLALPCFIVGFIKLDSKARWFLLLPVFLGFYVQQMMDVESGKVGFLLIMLILIPMMIQNLENAKQSSIIWITISGAGLLQSLLDKEKGLFNLSSSFWIFFALFLLSIIGAIVIFTWGESLHVKSPKRLAAIIMAILVITGAVIVIVNPTKSKQGAVYEANQIVKGNFDDSFGSNRVFIWKRSMQLIAMRPSFGTGPDSFRWAFKDNFEKEVKQINNNIYYDNAHNEYLQTTVNFGLIGLFIYLVSLWLALFYNRGKYKDPMISCGYYASICYLIQAFFSFSIVIVSPIFWIFLGICDSGSTYWPQEEVAESSIWPQIDKEDKSKQAVEPEEDKAQETIEDKITIDEKQVEDEKQVDDEKPIDMEKEEQKETLEEKLEEALEEEKHNIPEDEQKLNTPAKSEKEKLSKKEEEPDPYEILGLERWKRK